MVFASGVLAVQVDQLSVQLSEAQQQLQDKERLQSSLAAADRARREAEEKLAAALRHNAATARDLVTLREELKKLEGRQAKAGAAAAGEMDMALAQVRLLSRGLISFCDRLCHPTNCRQDILSQ